MVTHSEVAFTSVTRNVKEEPINDKVGDQGDTLLPALPTMPAEPSDSPPAPKIVKIENVEIKPVNSVFGDILRDIYICGQELPKTSHVLAESKVKVIFYR